jgi:hypothetical protein
MATPEQKLWVEAWRRAGPRLQQVRDAELKSLDENAGLRFLNSKPSADPRQSGMVAFQAWMMRWKALQLQQELQAALRQ